MMEPMSETPEVVLSKISKLWRSASGKGTTPAEREAAQQRALHLMAKYHVTEAQLSAANAADTIGEEPITETLKGGYRAPFEHLFAQLCEHFACRAVYMVRGNSSVGHAFGFTADIERVRLLWGWLYTDCAAGMAQLKGRSPANTRELRRSFAFGYAHQVGERLAAEMAAVIAEADGEADVADHTAPSVALVLADRSQQVDQAMAARNLKPMKRSITAPGFAGYDEGARAGARADLNPRSNKLRNQRALSRPS